MRVVILSKANIVGIYQRKLEAIARRGVELLAVMPPSWKDERGEQPLERLYTEGYTLQIIPIRFNGNFHLHYYPGVGRVIRQFRPQIIHIDEEPYNLAAWQALYHGRRVGAKTLFFSWQNILRQYPLPFAWGERKMLRTVDYALVGTASAGEVWRAKGYAGRMAVVPQFGVDTDLFHPIQKPEQRLFTIGYIGRLVEEKGVHLLLEAVSQLRDAWCLRIVGGGPERAKLIAQSERLGIADRVQFIDQRPSSEMPAQFHQLDVLVLPSLTKPNWKEQFGRVLVEAMASGVPVIGSDSGAIPDVIGDAGLIFAEGDIEALAAQLARLQGDAGLRAELGEAGRARALANFTHESVAEATVRVYQELLAL